MTPDTLLLRQVHPNFCQAGRITSQAFRPTPKDELMLSVDNGDCIQAQAAWQRFVSNPACQSIGVAAVSQSECLAQALPVVEDGHPYPEHCSIDFSGLDKKDIERKAKVLARQAQDRGWQFQA